MANLAFLNDPEWDFPFFKKLAANDTGNAPGHQGGMVIPTPLRHFFPNLTGQPSPQDPTIDHYIRAILLVDGRFVGDVVTRYQIQSWGGTRSAETRLTSNLGPLRDKAQAGDYLVLQRSLDNLNLYRLSLISQNTPQYAEFAAIVKDVRWGPVTKPPVAQQDMEEAEREIHAREAGPFTLFDEEPSVTQTITKRVARSLAFKKELNELYVGLCCVCRTGLRSPLGYLEVDAAHIVPKSEKGCDDVRNGLCLCKRHHWAFDSGLFTIDTNLRVFVPARVQTIAQNTVLSDFHGKEILLPSMPHLVPDPNALLWHKSNKLL